MVQVKKILKPIWIRKKDDFARVECGEESDSASRSTPPGSFPPEFGPSPSKVAIVLFYISCIFCVLGTIMIVHSFFYVKVLIFIFLLILYMLPYLKINCNELRFQYFSLKCQDIYDAIYFMKLIFFCFTVSHKFWPKVIKVYL